METTQSNLKRHNLSEEELQSELGRIKKQCFIAARELWLRENDIAIEELYTDYAIKFLDNPIKKSLSTKVYKYHVINKKFKQKKETISFSEVEAYYLDNHLEAKNNQYTDLIIDGIKKILEEDEYEKCLLYYNSLFKTTWQRNWWRGKDKERQALWKFARSRVDKIKKHLEKNSFLKSYLLKNLELANNYDFI